MKKLLLVLTLLLFPVVTNAQLLPAPMPSSTTLLQTSQMQSMMAGDCGWATATCCYTVNTSSGTTNSAVIACNGMDQYDTYTATMNIVNEYDLYSCTMTDSIYYENNVRPYYYQYYCVRDMN